MIVLCIVKVFISCLKWGFMQVHDLSPAARINPAGLQVGREWAGCRCFPAQVARSRCNPNRTPAGTPRTWTQTGNVTAFSQLWLKENGHLSIVHNCKRRRLTTDDADGHLVLQAAGHSAWGGLVRRGARTHLTAVVVAPRIHLGEMRPTFKMVETLFFF